MLISSIVNTAALCIFGASWLPTRNADQPSAANGLHRLLLIRETAQGAAQSRVTSFNFEIESMGKTPAVSTGKQWPKRFVIRDTKFTEPYQDEHAGTLEVILAQYNRKVVPGVPSIIKHSLKAKKGFADYRQFPHIGGLGYGYWFPDGSYVEGSGNFEMSANPLPVTNEERAELARMKKKHGGSIDA